MASQSLPRPQRATLNSLSRSYGDGFGGVRLVAREDPEPDPRGLQPPDRQTHILHQIVLDCHRALQRQSLLQPLLRLGRHGDAGVTRLLQFALK